jgi:hypothetical protein
MGFWSLAYGVDIMIPLNNGSHSFYQQLTWTLTSSILHSSLACSKVTVAHACVPTPPSPLSPLRLSLPHSNAHRRRTAHYTVIAPLIAFVPKYICTIYLT